MSKRAVAENLYGATSQRLIRFLRDTRPFYWSDFDFELTEDQIAMMLDAQSYGLKEGLTFPVHSGVGIAGPFSFGADMNFRPSTLQHISLELVGCFTYEHIEELLGAPKDIANQSLTDRERDVLTFIAQGKTNWEIGTILEISQYSVRDHLKSVPKRLGASNHTQTIVNAVQLGLIAP